MENWMKEIGVCLHIAELGVKPEMFDGIAKGSFILDGGYRKLTHEEIVQILKESMQEDSYEKTYFITFNGDIYYDRTFS